MSKKHNFPSFIDYTYTKWYFWVLVILYSVWSGYESLVNVYIGEFIGTLIAVIFIASLFFLLSYFLTRNTCKKLGRI